MREHFTGTPDLSSIILGQVKPRNKNFEVMQLFSLHSTYKKESENSSPPVMNF